MLGHVVLLVMTEADIATLLSDWQAMLGPVPPGAQAWSHGGHPALWRRRALRLHSLPGDKRYAECPAEMALILERQNTLIEHLVGEGTPYTLLFTQHGDDDIHAASYTRFVDDRLTLLFSLSGDDCTPEPYFSWRPYGEVRLYARQQRWVRGSEDALLAAVADDAIAGLLLFCPARDVLVAPYDGGVTVIAASPSQRIALRRAFAAWCPGRSDLDPSLVIASAQPAARSLVAQLKAQDATVYLGKDGAVEVVTVFKTGVDDALLAQLGALPRLRTLMLVDPGPDVVENRAVTDAGLAHLHGLTGLDALSLEGFTGITAAGVSDLCTALTGCEVSWEPAD